MNSSPLDASSNLSVPECIRFISGAMQRNLDSSEVRADLVLSRLRLGSAMDELESHPIDNERLGEASCHAKNIVAEIDALLESLAQPTYVSSAQQEPTEG